MTNATNTMKENAQRNLKNSGVKKFFIVALAQAVELIQHFQDYF